MRDQFTQQLFINNAPFTFLFTANAAGDNNVAYLVSVINNPAIQPFCMCPIEEGCYEIDQHAFIPQEIKDIHYQLNQAINNYHIMRSLLIDKEPVTVNINQQLG